MAWQQQFNNKEETLFSTEERAGNCTFVKKVTTPKNEVYIDIRRYFIAEETEDWRPTTKGARLHSESFGDLIKATFSCMGEIERNQLLLFLYNQYMSENSGDTPEEDGEGESE